MKRMLFIVFLLIESCSMFIPNASIEHGEVLVPGMWAAYSITTSTMLFRTPVGIKTINYPVEVVYHEGKWYTWENGYRMEIELINQGEGK